MNDCIRARDFLREKLGISPETAIVSGSGLHEIANAISNPVTVKTEDVPNWPRPTVPTHKGIILAGEIHGRNVVILQGRIHYYEGYSMRDVTFPVRVLGALGVKEYIATNAAGAVNTSFRPGDIVAVSDHINLMGDNPLRGENSGDVSARFTDMTNAYDPGMLAIMSGLGLKTGVYAAMTGPSFETPAEIRMLRIMGADVVGMSTVPEIIAANALGMRAAALSCVANMAAGVQDKHRLTADEVFDNMRDCAGKVSHIITEIIRTLQEG